MGTVVLHRVSVLDAVLLQRWLPRYTRYTSATRGYGVSAHRSLAHWLLEEEDDDGAGWLDEQRIAKAPSSWVREIVERFKSWLKKR